MMDWRVLHYKKEIYTKTLKQIITPKIRQSRFSQALRLMGLDDDVLLRFVYVQKNCIDLLLALCFIAKSSPYFISNTLDDLL